MELIQAAARN